MGDRRGKEQGKDGERREKGGEEGEAWGTRRMYERQEREGTGKEREKEGEGGEEGDMGNTENV